MPIYPYSFQLPPLNVQDIPNDGVAGQFLGISAGGVLDWLPVSSASGDMLKSENLSGLASYPTARTNLGLGLTDTPTFKNLVISTGSIATSAPVTISQTWNDAAVAFTGLNIGITDTNSAATSSLFSVKRTVGMTTSTLFSVEKEKIKLGALGYYTESGNVPRINSAYGFYVSTGGSDLNFNFVVNNDNSVNIGGFQNGGRLYKDGNHQLGLRDGAAAQTFNVYGTYTSGSVYERMFARYDGTALAFQVGTQHVGASARPLQLLTDNTARMTIGTTGNVGIGTTAPAEKLHVLGGKVLFGDAADTTGTAGNGDLTLQAWRAPQLNMVANSSSGAPFGLNLKSGAATLAGMTLNIGSGEVKIGGFSIGGYFPTFYSNNAEIMRISTAGNVGIGTTAPAANLSVVGNISVRNVTTGLNTGYGIEFDSNLNVPRFSFVFNSAYSSIIGQTSDTLQLKTLGSATNITLGSNSAPNQVVLKTDTGNLGIGTTAPAGSLHIRNDQAAFTGIYVDNRSGGSGSYSGISLGSNSSGGQQWFLTRENQTTARLDIALNLGSPFMSILAGGNVGIGTTAPSSKLHVAGTIKPEQATMVDKAAGFTLAAVDAGTIINSTSATAITINLPAADTATGYNVMIIQSGAGAVTIGQNGNTLNSFGGAVITAGQHAACSIVRTAASTYNLSGNLV
jgi:hypothetical protein